MGGAGDMRTGLGTELCPWCMREAGNGEVCPYCGNPIADYVPASRHLPPGTLLAGRYLVGRAIGDGVSDVTYIARDLRLDVRCAIKEYYPVGFCTRAAGAFSVVVYSGIADEYRSYMARFFDEARRVALLGRLRVVVGVRNLFEANGTAYVVMDYVEGQTLRSLISSRGGRMPAAELLGILEPLFDGLSDIHAAGLVLCDVAPDNVIFEQGRGVRLFTWIGMSTLTTAATSLRFALLFALLPTAQ